MTYVLSDLHGRFDKYKEMLSYIEFAPEDTLYVLGDVIDRGPDGVQILQDMMGRANVLPLLGNHEFTAAVCIPWLLKEVTEKSIAALDETQLAALSEWLVNGGGPTIQGLKAIGREEREDLLEYLGEMELYVQVEAGSRRFLLTHSALDHFSPDKALEDYELEDFLFGRPEPDAVYYRDQILIFGHTPTQVLGSGGEILRRETWIDIDCGCAFKGGQLGCLCLDTMEEFYV